MREKALLYLKNALLLFGFVLAIILIYRFLIIKPSNNRDFEIGMDTLAHIQIQGSQVDIQNIRDYHFQPEKITSTGYINRTVDINKLEKVWFVVEPFGAFTGVAHTYFVFDFQDQQPIAVSVEARREKGEKYDSFLGTFNKYELIYIWGSESDETLRRVLYENNKLYMYPLAISNQGSKELFLQLAYQTQSLETTPRFYNTLTSNCTNELAKVANRVKPNAIPFNIALFLPGYAPSELYKLGFIPNTVPQKNLSQKYYISDFVKQNYSDPDLTTKLRAFLLGT